MTATGVAAIALKTLPIFQALDDERLARISRVSTLRSVPRQTVILRAGDKTDNVYFVLNGSLKVLVSDDEGREVILSMLGRGDLFGEMGVIDDDSRSATVVAAQSSDLVVISKNDFKATLAENFDISLYLMRSLVQRLRSADRTIESLALLDVYGRVARLLLDMAETMPSGEKVIKRKPSRQDIAKMIGASREMVSRVMKDLQQQGLIQENEDGLMIVHGEA
ncbi:MAG: cyclic nucleotide-binding domain-containing protein [Rhodocyclales bacterium]|nr:cyclic nucleotide-binding domain-containing protein [Rhodocyclales bacterium]